MSNKRIAIVFALLCIASTAMSQEDLSNSTKLPSMQLTLDQAIRQAQDSSLVAFTAAHYLEQQKWGYEAYLASRGPQVDLVMNPAYLKQGHYTDYNYVSASEINMLTSDAGITYSQQISPLGGYLYADSKYIWSEYLGDMRDLYGIDHQMATMPLRVGYKQELLGWNSFKWQQRIEQSSYEKAQRTFTYQLLQIAESATAYYFNYLNSKQYCDIYEQNYLTADTLYKIGQRKFELTTVTKEELMSLDLEERNARNQLDLARAELENARRSLLSFLQLKDYGQNIEAIVPDVPEQLDIDIQKAIDLALKHNPEILEMDHSVLEAESALDEARHRARPNIGLDMSVGIHQHGNDWAEAFGPQKPYVAAQMSVSIPLYDSGRRRKLVSQAKEAFMAAETQAQEQRRQIEDDVRSVINLLISQHHMMQDSKESVSLSDEAFSLIGKRYADGMLDINTYQFAMSRKDQAHQIYISLLSNFWSNYFKLCRLTMYDFLKNENL